MRTLFAGVLTLLAAGCAQNAFFELQIELPARPPGETWYAQVQIRDAARHPFNIAWMGGDTPSVELTGEPQWDCISVQGMDESLDLHVRVRFCHSQDCLALVDGNPLERLYTIEHPFYIGRRTYYSIEVAGIPDCSTTADCTARAVGVCIDERCGCAADDDCGEGYLCAPLSGCVREIVRCAVEGCIDGVSGTFCTMDGRHFCEENANISRDGTYHCPLPD